MIYNYEAAEVIDIGQAQEVILGSAKNAFYTVYDGPTQLPRMDESAEDE